MPHAYPHLSVWFYNWFPKFEGVGEGWAWHFLKWQEEVGKKSLRVCDWNDYIKPDSADLFLQSDLTQNA